MTATATEGVVAGSYSKVLSSKVGSFDISKVSFSRVTLDENEIEKHELHCSTETAPAQTTMKILDSIADVIAGDSSMTGAI